tara:strand:- start:44 stop:394 length:351 start_codon:yes stop_codon:yes gene_type:complete
MIKRVKLLVEKFAEAWTACMICMVQGDVTVLTLSHAFTASKTGILTGVAMVVASSSFLPWDNKWVGIFLTGIFTMIADIIVHPTHFGPEWLEAVCTGFGAMMLALIYSRAFMARRD